MKKYSFAFTRVQLLLLLGVSWLVSTLTTTTKQQPKPFTIIGCEAFVGSHVNTKNVKLEKRSQTAGRRLSPSLSSPSSSSPLLVLGATTGISSSSQDSVLLEGKLVVLQDVVKELDARLQALLERSEAAQEVYQKDLQSLERDLEASKQSKGEQETMIAALEKDLETANEKLAKDLVELETTKDKERQQESQQLVLKHEERLQKLQTDHENTVQTLEGQLATKERLASDLGKKLTETQEEASRLQTEKDALIQELREELATQQQTAEESLVPTTTTAAVEEEDSESRHASAMAELKAQHQEVVEEYQRKIGALRDEKDELASTLKAEHEGVVQDYCAKLEALQAEKETLSSDLQVKHQQVVQDYEAQLETSATETKQLQLELESLSAKCEEQVEIATASVEAGQAREQTLRNESEALSQRVRVYWLVAKLSYVYAHHLDAEHSLLETTNGKLASENSELLHELETTKRGVQDLIEQIQNESNMWQKLRSKVSPSSERNHPPPKQKRKRGR